MRDTIIVTNAAPLPPNTAFIIETKPSVMPCARFKGDGVPETGVAGAKLAGAGVPAAGVAGKGVPSYHAHQERS